MDRQAEQIITLARAKRCMLRTVESCTGGLVFSRLTSISGASAVLDRGFLTYSNQAKQDMVGVSPDTLARYGAVSEQTATEMAIGAVRTAQPLVAAISITGIAGPDGGTKDKPVGLVHMACAILRHQNALPDSIARYEVFDGDRQAIREAAGNKALGLLAEQLEQL